MHVYRTGGSDAEDWLSMNPGAPTAGTIVRLDSQILSTGHVNYLACGSSMSTSRDIDLAARPQPRSVPLPDGDGEWLDLLRTALNGTDRATCVRVIMAVASPIAEIGGVQLQNGNASMLSKTHIAGDLSAARFIQPREPPD
jgi:hypothetical protein